MRRFVALIALVGLSLLLLRPACDVLALQVKGSQLPLVAVLHHDSAADAGHGGALRIGFHESSLAAVASAVKALPLVAVPTGPALALPALRLFLARLPAPGDAPPPPRSYYARSARILR